MQIRVLVCLQNERKRQKAKLKVVIASIEKLLLALPRSPLTHAGVSFTRLRRIDTEEKYRGLFLDEPQLAAPLPAKYFSLKNAWTVVGIQNAALMHC